MLTAPDENTYHGIPLACSDGMMISFRLLRNQRISANGLLELKRLHEERIKLFIFMRKLCPSEDNHVLQVCGRTMEKIDIALQRTWKFADSKRKRGWWSKVPYCSCTCMGYTMFGARLSGLPNKGFEDELFINSRAVLGVRLYNSTCPVHGEHS